VTSVEVVAVGARPFLGEAVDPDSGLGATVTADIPVSPGQVLYVEVDIDDEQFGLGGPSNFGEHGGGASDVRTCSVPCTLTGQPESDPRLVVAGGGGAGGGGLGRTTEGLRSRALAIQAPAAAVGGSSGKNGKSGADGPGFEAGGGGGGTQIAGGTGGQNSDGEEVGTAGRPGVGGASPFGGGGGSGWFGGGSGAPAGESSGNGSGGGGGGSSFGPRGTTFAAVAESDPQVRISVKDTVLVGSTILIENRPPSVSIARPADGGHYPQGSRISASYSCRDPDGAVDLLTCKGTVADGARIDTRSLGTHSFTVKVKDRARAQSFDTIRFTIDPSTVEPPPPGQVVTPPPPPPLAAPPPLRQAALPPPVARATPMPPRLGASSEPGITSSRPRPAAPVPFIADIPGGPEPAKIVALMVAAFTLLRFAVGGGFALTGMVGVLDGGRSRAGVGAVGAARAASKRLGDAGDGLEGSEVEDLHAPHRGIRWGDRSRTWRWPGTPRLDAMSKLLPVGLALRSSMMARVTADGVYARSMLGAAAVVWQVAGLILGVLAVRNVDGDALPPSTTLTIAIAMLGVLDATAGLIAVLTFAIGVAALGGLDSAAAVRTLLGLCSLWFVIPVLAGAARPLRRLPAANRQEAWDRWADLAIASLIGAWAVQEIVSALPGLAGREDLPIAAHADAIALWVLLALAIRIASETVAAYLYPRRLRSVQPRDLPTPGQLQRLAAVAGRTAVFVFVAHVVVGSTWQLWAGAALFLAPEVLSIYGDSLPKVAWLARVLPRGLVEVVLVLLVTTGIGALLVSSDYDPETIIPDAFVILSLPGFVLSMLGLLCPDDERPLGWRRRIAGVPLLALAVAVVLGGIPGCGRELCAPTREARVRDHEHAAQWRSSKLTASRSFLAASSSAGSSAARESMSAPSASAMRLSFS
jgi:hypothetical protein